MTEAAVSELLHQVWDFPLFAALYGRRSRRLYERHRRQLANGRLSIPRRTPPLFGHNLWNCNQPGTTLFMPVTDVSMALIALVLSLVDGEGGRFVRGQGGGFNIIDDRQGGRPAGTTPWIARGLIDAAKPLPLSILERQACYFMFSEPAVMCQNMFLATEAMGIGGWMHCGFLSLEVMRALGFRMMENASDFGPTGAYPNPVGCDGLLEGFCPPYYPDMDAAVDAALASLRSDRAAAALQPYTMAEEAYRAAILDVPGDAGIACAKSVCRYIYETYGRFPASVDTMHLMWFMQAHHLDVDYYTARYAPGALGARHADHMATWHRKVQQ